MGTILNNVPNETPLVVGQPTCVPAQFDAAIPKDIYSLVANRCKNSTDADRVLMCILAKILADVIPVPNVRVVEPATYFRSFAIIEDLISSFNERTPVNVGEARDLAERLWQIRHDVTHPTARIIASDGFDFFCTWFGVPAYISNEEFAFLTCNKNTINFYAEAIQCKIAA